MAFLIRQESYHKPEKRESRGYGRDGTRSDFTAEF